MGLNISNMEDFQKGNEHSLEECYENLIAIVVDTSLSISRVLFEK